MKKDKVLKILWENQHEIGFGNRAITIDKFEIIAEEIVKMFDLQRVNNTVCCPRCSSTNNCKTDDHYCLDCNQPFSAY